MNTVLLVEDEWLIARSQAAALSDAGFNVHIAVDATSALVAANAMQLDAAIIDMGLPDRSGADVARDLRARHPILPIVLCTGYDARALSALATEIGLRIVEKPIDETALLAALCEQMQGRTQLTSLTSPDV